MGSAGISGAIYCHAIRFLPNLQLLYPVLKNTVSNSNLILYEMVGQVDVMQDKGQ